MALGYVGYLIGHWLNRKLGYESDSWYVEAWLGVGIMALVVSITVLVVSITVLLITLIYYNWQWATVIAQ